MTSSLAFHWMPDQFHSNVQKNFFLFFSKKKEMLRWQACRCALKIWQQINKNMITNALFYRHNGKYKAQRLDCLNKSFSEINEHMSKSFYFLPYLYKPAFNLQEVFRQVKKNRNIIKVRFMNYSLRRDVHFVWIQTFLVNLFRYIEPHLWLFYYHWMLVFVVIA